MSEESMLGCCDTCGEFDCTTNHDYPESFGDNDHDDTNYDGDGQ